MSVSSLGQHDGEAAGYGASDAPPKSPSLPERRRNLDQTRKAAEYTQRLVRLFTWRLLSGSTPVGHALFRLRALGLTQPDAFDLRLPEAIFGEFAFLPCGMPLILRQSQDVLGFALTGLS
jgi:hypothetical protein